MIRLKKSFLSQLPPYISPCFLFDVYIFKLQYDLNIGIHLHST